MNILCFIDSLGSGGAQRQLVNLAIEFKKYGCNVEFLVYHRNDFYKDILSKNSIKVIYLEEKSYFRRILSIRQFIRRNDYDVVLSFLEAPNFIAEISSFPYRKWKLVVGERSADPQILKSFKKKFLRFFHLFATNVVSNSYANLEMVLSVNPCLKTSKCKVIYNMVEIDSKRDVRQEENCDRIKILVAATHRYVKNAIGLVEGFNLLSEEDKSRFVITWYGDIIDGSFEEVKKRIEEYNLGDFFTFHEATDLIYEKMKQSDVIGLFSFYEGLPNVVCEAMKLSKTVISSRVSDVPILLEHCSDLLFDPNNHEEISKVLSGLSKKSEAELSRIGALNNSKAEGLFDREVIVDEYLKLF